MQRVLSMLKTISAVNSATRTFSLLPSLGNALEESVKRGGMLKAHIPIFNVIRSFKIKGRVRRRCQSCYIVVRDERMYVMCPKYPRHKQMSMKPKPHNTWVLTHASQSRIRPW